ncbi:dihydrodipicolinate synthase family protein [uncultured Mucilaginibacter sp.]|uniref:dihydrodipicolinate synthase family protein n=1 Tax=uncultured Mucilaginibacter sp. TaxID=797541 RepID=UPI0025CC9ED2|nr:dihydrodipicolinate synthase family protein [uncultured Mucilaginibacter sp.]
MKIQKKYKGTVVPLVTPLTARYELDEQAVERIVLNLYKNDAMPFILGTTGESASLPATLKHAFIKATAALKQPGSEFYVGISSNCFEESVELAKSSLDAGAAAVAATLPTYYHLSEDQMKDYFVRLADAVAGPVIIYNIPATTHMSIPLELIDELSHHEFIVGTKDSERNDGRLDRSLELWSGREDFSHFLGWAAKSAYALLNGGDGLIPSTGNVAPEIYCEMTKAVIAGDTEKAYHYQHLSDTLGNVYQSGRTLGESLRALKVLMQENGLCDAHMMPPLSALHERDEQNLVKSYHQLLQQESSFFKQPSNV